MNIENPEGVAASGYCGEEQYRRLFENTSEMVVIAELAVDKRNMPVDWVYHDVNHAFVDIIGIPKERVLGHRHTEVFGITEPMDEQLRLYTDVVATGKPSRTEVYFKPLNKHFLISAFPLHGMCFGSTSTDITKHKRAEAYLQRYSLLSQFARDIILFVGTDGRIIEANDAALRTYGYTRDELLSINISDIRAPETSDQLLGQMETADREGILFETFHRRRDGSVFPVEVSSRGSVIGGQRVLLSIIRDITDRRQTEQELDEERRRLQTVLDALLVGVIIADSRGRIVHANRQAKEVWGGEPPLVQSIDEYSVFKGWWAENNEPIKPYDWGLVRAIRNGETAVNEVIDIERFDGARATLLNSSAPIKDAAGRITGGVVSMQDITELTMLRKALERSLDETRRERERAAALESIAEAGISTMEFHDLLVTLAERMSKALQTHSCTIMILDRDKNEFVTQAAYGEPQEMGSRVKISDGFIGRINRERRTVYICDAQSEPSIANPHIKESGVRSLLGTPLIVRGKVVGVAYVNMKKIREYRPDEVRLLETMASRAAQAIDNATLYAQVVSASEELSEALRLERSFSLLLQRALLPRKPSIGDDYRVATYYSPAQADQEIGGDFYDVFVDAEGKTGIVIGDVSGKGLEAAALAATARSTIHAFAHETDLAAEALTRANAVLYPQQPDIGSFVSIFLAILNRSTGDINY
ncbi:PAS domain S-box protein, partial [bacterium]|nr:PAS domain S-box protein [bacterium]